MSVDTNLDAAFNLLLQKSLRIEPERPAIPGGIAFYWSGGGQALDITSVDPLIAEVPFDARLVWAHIWAGDGLANAVAVDATVDLRLTNISQFGTSTSVYQSGAIPALSGAASADLNITNWIVDFVTGDTLLALPTAFVGTATWIALTLQLRPVDSGNGVIGVTSNAGTGMTFNNGNFVVYRSP